MPENTEGVLFDCGKNGSIFRFPYFILFFLFLSFKIILLKWRIQINPVIELRVIGYWLLSCSLLRYEPKTNNLTELSVLCRKMHGVVYSRREYMFIGKYSKILSNPEGIICQIALFLHTIPSGLGKILFFCSYKHIFPSGM